jgi:hypothetical protein
VIVPALLAAAVSLALPAPGLDPVEDGTVLGLHLDPEGAASAAPAPAPEPDAATTSTPGPEPSAATTAAPGPEPSAATTSAPPAREGDNWLDIGHAFIEDRIFQPALWVDRFFADQRDLEAERARSFIQWRQEGRISGVRHTLGYTTTVNANLKFPGVNKQLGRLQLEISGQTRDAFTALFPGESTAAGTGPLPGQSFGTADAGLGYRLFETVASTFATHGDLGAGFILEIPPGVYLRARLRFVESLGYRVLARQALTGFWRTDTYFGSTASADFDRPLPLGTLVRLSGTSTITEKSLGFEWSGTLALIATLKLHVGAQVGLAVQGATGAPANVANVEVYRAFLRLRRDVYRRWIFVELAPEYDWAWLPDRARRVGSWAVGLRLEVQFQGNEAARAPIPGEPGPPEPADPAPAR